MFINIMYVHIKSKKIKLAHTARDDAIFSVLYVACYHMFVCEQSMGMLCSRAGMGPDLL